MANTPQTYADQFRSLQPEKLADIIVGEQDYHPDAVEAARLELTARMLPMEELDRLYDTAEEKRAKKEEVGIGLSIDKNLRAKSISASLSKKAGNMLWGRTTILKIIGTYLLFNLGIGIYQFISSYLNSSVFGMSLEYAAILLIGPGILLLIIGAGIKGYKAAWWASLVLFILIAVNAILNAYNTYNYYSEFDDDPNGMGLGTLLEQFVDDPSTAGFKLLLPSLLIYLLLRKDTRVACGITRAEDAEYDELDHLL